jgi:hypothetical protein
MYSEFPARKTILNMQTVSYSDYTVVEIPQNANIIIVNNYSSLTSGIKINSGEYILQPGEKQEFPIVSPDTSVVPAVAGDALEIKGDVSFIMENIQEY